MHLTYEERLERFCREAEELLDNARRRDREIESQLEHNQRVIRAIRAFLIRAKAILSVLRTAA